MQNTESTIYFNFSYFALRLLGKGLYSNHWTAIAELVANGLDAQADSVKIYINLIDQENASIEIFDNGSGMDYNDLSEKYVLIGKDKREDDQISEEIKKQLMGRKGIGKLAALYMSNKYYLVSKKNGKETAWCLDASNVKDSDIPKLDKCIVSNIGIGSFEGVYVANRDNFDDKSYLLINKNARRLTSLSNIRGYLMDQTSENDFTVQSYILYKFDKLTSVQKQEISNILLEYIKTKKHEFTEKVDDQIANLEKDGIKNINKILGLSSELFPISLKYEIFAKMLEYDSELTFDDVTVEQYLSEIVKARNTLAHKKLDVCRTQEYILYYDTMRQLEARKCPEDCIEHSENYKISINEWNELRKKIHAFGNEVDETQKKLQKIEAETN